MPRLTDTQRTLREIYKKLEVPRQDWDLPSGSIIAFAHGLHVPAGPKVAQPLRLKPFQMEFIRDVYNPRRDDGRRQRRQAILSVGRRNGKALALDTPIPTPFGFVPMRDLDVGDLVIGSDGQPTTIRHVHSTMIGRPCFRITFSDGDSVVCDEDHLWTVRGRKGKVLTLRTADMARDFMVNRPDGRTERRYSVDAPPPATGFSTNLPLPPYELGVWLGDGHSSSARLCLNENDAPTILAQFKEDYYFQQPQPGAVSVQISTGIFTQEARDVSFHARLRNAGVLHDKHIPEVYFSAPEADRWRLLQGMFDTDGHVNEHGQADQIFKHEQLATQYVSLLRSLGIKASAPQPKIATINRRSVGTYWRVNFYPYADQPVSTLPRHLVRRRSRPARNDHSRTITITNIESIASVPVRCITVSAEDGIFLCGDYKPTHNSATAAVLILAHLAGPLKKPNSHIVSAALTRKQASLIFQYAMYIVQSSRTLKKVVKVLESTKRLIHRDDGSYYEAIAAEAGGQFGMGLDFCVYDELGQARDRRLYDTLMTSLGSQPEGLMMIISTQAPTDQHILSELIDYGERIKGTDEDPSFTCHLYSHPKDMPIDDRRGWKMANPGLGDYRDEEELAAAVKRAKSLPSDEAAVRQFLLNQRVQAEAPFLSPDVYEGNGNSGPVNLSLFKDGRPVHGGIDLSGRADLTGLVLTTEDDDGNVHLLPFGWTPGDTLMSRQARDRAPYDAWVRQGLLIATPGSYIDYDYVAQQIGEITAGMNVVRLEYDPWRIDILAAAFARIGGMMPLFKRPQTFQFMSPCIEAFEELALAGRLRHGNHPVLKWCMSNTVVLRNAEESRKLDKAKSYGRIDLAQAGVMAVGSLKVGAPAIEIAALIA